MYKLTASNSVIRTADGAVIPFDDGNQDYQIYLSWLGDGNVPAAADVVAVDPNAAIQAKIFDIEQTLQPRAMREYFLNGDKTRLQEIENQIAALRAQLA
jgi:hypothetical protein